MDKKKIIIFIILFIVSFFISYTMLTLIPILKEQSTGNFIVDIIINFNFKNEVKSGIATIISTCVSLYVVLIRLNDKEKDIFLG